MVWWSTRAHGQAQQDSMSETYRIHIADLQQISVIPSALCMI